MARLLPSGGSLDHEHARLASQSGSHLRAERVLRHAFGPAARVRRSFHEDSPERNSRPPRKTKGRLAFLGRWSTISLGWRGRACGKSLISRLQAEARRRILTDGAAVAERRLLGRQLSGVVGGRRARVQSWLATGRQWQPARRAACRPCRRPPVPLKTRSPQARIRAER